MSEPEWIRFVETAPMPGRKTKCWRVVSKENEASLGWVLWNTGWRRYVFEPYAETIYEQTCLRDLAAFCEQRTSEQRSTWSKRRR